MSKAFTKETDDETDEDAGGAPPLPPGLKNYMTPGGHGRLIAEMDALLRHERPELVKVVSWAASNGDRSENGDYLYGKRRLREIDRRLRYLKRQLDRAEVIDPITRESDQVFFGATVSYAELDGTEHTVSIVGVDEADVHRGYISWMSPVARALTKAREGDTVVLRVPTGAVEIDVVTVRYLALDTHLPPTSRIDAAK
jgi:transcription elongation factor GreB